MGGSNGRATALRLELSGDQRTRHPRVNRSGQRRVRAGTRRHRIRLRGCYRMVSEYCLLADAGTVELSIAMTVNVNVPAALGVPDSMPSSESVSPGGSEPLVTLQ